MGAVLRLSWLVGAQVGAKRGKLTLLGGLKSTKLELRGALEGAKRAPRGPKSAMGGIDGAARHLIFGPVAPPK